MSFSHQSAYGPVAIIPASAIKENRDLLTNGQPHHSQQQQHRKMRGEEKEIPINLAYYMAPDYNIDKNSNYNYFTTPRHLDTGSYYAPPTSYYPYPPTHQDIIYPKKPSKKKRTYSTTNYYPSERYPQHTLNSCYNGYDPSLKRLRRPYEYRSRSFNAAPARSVVFPDKQFCRHNINHVCSFTGPVKYPEPLYRKHSNHVTPSAASGRKYFYPTAASYTTYPSSSVGTAERRATQRYGVCARITMKIAQLICGAIVIGCVAGPARGEYFHGFVVRTRSEGQLYVMVVACICLIITFLFLITVFLAKSSQGWRNADGAYSVLATIVYIVAGCVESWYAACYPPLGAMFSETCDLGAWIAAAVFTFLNAFLYMIDFLLAARTGIDIL